MSTEIDLAAIKARVEAASPGPWEAQDDGEIFAPEQDGWRPTVVRADMSTAASAEDAAFIASAREDVPALVAEVERLRGLLEITDAMVERARVAYVAAHYWQVRRGVDADFSKPMRAALEAALGVNH